MRFVILDHSPPEPTARSAARTDQRHFDLMFEVAAGQKLKTIAVLQLPLCVGEEVQATALKDHRADFLVYEGPLTKDRGDVERFAQGSWKGELPKKANLNFSDTSANFSGESWEIQFDLKRSTLLRIS